MVKETIFKTIAIGADSIAIGERSDPTSNTKKTSMQSWGSVDGKLLTRDFKNWDSFLRGFLQKAGHGFKHQW